MTNIYPSQSRAVDPYSSYNSNNINELTRVITNGNNCIYGPSDLQVRKNADNPDTVLDLLPGRCFKDDVMIEIPYRPSYPHPYTPYVPTDSTAVFTIDTTDPAFYEAGIRDMEGMYYVVLKYTYLKSRPAPQAAIKILRPDQYSFLDGGGYLFLKAFNVIDVHPHLVNDQVYDYDVANLPDAQRVYIDTRAGAVNTLPFWYLSQTGRIIYVEDRDELFWGLGSGIDGTYTGWETFTGIRDDVDTSLCTVGQIGYITPPSSPVNPPQVQPAISTAISTLSNCVVMTVHPIHGKVRLCGTADSVPVESGIFDTTNVGDKLWLSQITAGTCTNVSPSSGIGQMVGTCVKKNVPDGTFYIWFFPGFSEDLNLGNTAAKKYRPASPISGGDWVSDVIYSPPGMYKATIVHGLGVPNPFTVSVQCYDVATSRLIQPVDIQIVDANTIYIWMPDNTHSLNVIVLG